jgi:integrase
LTEGSKNLATVDTTQQTKEQDAGATKTDLSALKGEIISFLVYLKNQQYPENTIKVYGRILENLLRKGVDLFNSEAVKQSIANEETSTNTKASKLCAYARFMRWKRIPWEQPRMSREEKDPFLPQISEVNELVSGSGWKLKAFLQLIWECALRSIEANELLWEEVDQVSRTIRIRPRKRGTPRTLRITEKCLRMLMALPRNSPKVFGSSTLTSKRTSFELTRKRLVRQLGNLRLKQIHFHTLRHLRATIWYRSGVDLKTLQERLGHRNITHTLRYVHIAEAMFPEMPDEYFTRVTVTLKEGELLVQQGFEFVGKDESGCLWRKKKTYEDVVKEREISENS